MYSALEWLLGAGIVTVLLTQIITIARSVIGSLITRSRARKGLLRLLYTEVAQNKVNADYVAPLLDQPDTAKGVLAMRGRYVSAEAWKASRVDLAQNISSKHFAVLSDYYKNVLLLDEVVTVEREKKTEKLPTRRVATRSKKLSSYCKRFQNGRARLKRLSEPKFPMSQRETSTPSLYRNRSFQTLRTQNPKTLGFQEFATPETGSPGITRSGNTPLAQTS